MKCFVKRKNVSFTDLQLQWEKFTFCCFLSSNILLKSKQFAKIVCKIEIDKLTEASAKHYYHWP